jgi:hypothetical protein
LAQQLGLPVIDQQNIGGVGGSMVANIYLAQIYVPSLNETIYGQFAGVHLVAGGQQHVALIGRTFLVNFTMVYDGRSGLVTLIDLASGDQGPVQPPTAAIIKPDIKPTGPLLPGLGGGPWKA